MADLHSSQWLSSFRRRIAKWYAAAKRPLPWRETRDPYAIWVSEIMLQQTQVATVIDYYHRFLERFPDVTSLANASESEVLALWSGLGYYRRARQLHAAAKVIQHDYQGQFPAEFEQVLSLPGVGRYTAGAITSFAYDSRRPVLEANTIRLFSRLIALRDDPRLADSQTRLWDFAEAILPRHDGSAAINQAVMELGSLVCTPTNPNCEACPLADICPTHELGLQAEIPLPKPKKQISELAHVLTLIQNQGRFLVRQNEKGEWWEGLWDFPRATVNAVPAWLAKLDQPALLTAPRRAKLETIFKNQLGLDCQVHRWVRTLRHTVTRYRIQLHCFEAGIAEDFDATSLAGQWKWVTPKQLAALPKTSTANKLCGLHAAIK